MQSKTTILYVDDNPKSSRVLTNILEECGFHVIAKNDPAEVLDLCAGISLCKKEYFELLLLDYEMPKMSGANLAHELKLLLPETPIVLLSSKSELPSEELRCVDAHFGHGTALDDLVWTMRILVQHPHVVVGDHSSVHAEGFEQVLASERGRGCDEGQASNHARGRKTDPQPQMLKTQRHRPSDNHRECLRWADST